MIIKFQGNPNAKTGKSSSPLRQTCPATWQRGSPPPPQFHKASFINFADYLQKLVVDKKKQKSCFKMSELQFWPPGTGNIVSAALVSCCYLINPTSQATVYVVPPCKDFVWYIKMIIRCPKNCSPSLLSFNIHTIFRATIFSVAPVAISQSQAVLLYTSLCDPRLSRFPEAATAIMCFSNKCVIYIVFFCLKVYTHLYDGLLG